MSCPVDAPETSERRGEHAPRDEIKRLRKSYERESADGRTFVLVDCLTKEFESKHTLYSVMRPAHEAVSDEPPDMRSEHLSSRYRILYILLELDHLELMPLFRRLEDHQLPISKQSLQRTLDEDELRRKLGDGWENFYDEFCKSQIAWCPLFFDLGIDWDKKIGPHRIIPFYDKIQIRPYGAGQEPAEDHAKLYEVHIPAELVVAPGLESAHLLNPSNIDGDQSASSWPFYRFALKEFPASLRSSYEKEVKTFRALGAQSGIIQYYGCYESWADRHHPTYNILLEYAEFDLNVAVVEEAPPVSPDEIKSFWESMLEVSTTLTQIHHLDIEGQKYDFWHGDIKPENILRVGDHFKLADPGDSWIQRAHADNSLRPKAEVYGGTRTYAAPEKAQWLEADNATKNPGKIFQNSDVWSLGCVFSIAATYVVLGVEGVRIYDSIRNYTHEILNRGLVSDVFHDNEKVLDTVTDWHKYLRNSARVSDGFTATVLDMVDQHMLVMPPEQRWDAEQVSAHFSDLMKRADAGTRDVPKAIEKILQDLDL